MRLTFIGTRGYMEPRTPRHTLNTSLLITHSRHRTMIDAGEDWLGKLDTVRPHEILVTHAHPDHAWGLAQGAPCPVYTTAETWKVIAEYPIEKRVTVSPGEQFKVGRLTVEPFSVQHSITAPAVGYRISDGKRTIFYAADLVYIDEREKALAGVDLYIGDASTVSVSFVRKQKGQLVGHTPVRTQLTWCMKSGVPRAVMTHFGPEILKGDEDALFAKVQEEAEKRGVEVAFAHDGMELLLQ